MENPLEKQLLAATLAVEKQVDAEIERLEKAAEDEDELEILRRKRLESMKAAEKQRQEWLASGHGIYEELADESEFFAASKKSHFFVCHFFRNSTPRCKIVDKHLALLAPRHVETKFSRIDAERARFLVDRLRIKVMPTICLAKDGKTVDYIAGFDDLGGIDEFSTEMLEWRIARAGVIEYSGDLLKAPLPEGASAKSKLLGRTTKKTIRGQQDCDDSDDSDD